VYLSVQIFETSREIGQDNFSKFVFRQTRVLRSASKYYRYNTHHIQCMHNAHIIIGRQVRNAYIIVVYVQLRLTKIHPRGLILLKAESYYKK